MLDVKSVLTREMLGYSSGMPHMIYRFGNYELEAQRCELRCAGQLVAIEPKVFEVLAYLLQHRDRVVTKEELLEQCWAGTFVSDAALTRCLAKVRKVVEAEPAGAPVIQTRYGRGYRFVAPVTVRPHEPVLSLLPPLPPSTPRSPTRPTILIVPHQPFPVEPMQH